MMVFWRFHVLVAGTFLCVAGSSQRFGVAAEKKERSIDVSLHAEWPVTTAHSPIQEAAEFMSEESATLNDPTNNLFWSYIDATVKLGLDVNGVNDMSVEDAREVSFASAVRTAEGLLSPLSSSLLQLSLSIRAYAPALELHRTLAKDIISIDGHPTKEECFGAWVVFMPSETVACTVDDMVLILSSSSGGFDLHQTTAPGTLPLQDFDHQYPFPAELPLSSDTETIILYGTLGTPAFAEFHTKLSSLVNLGRAKYILRHRIGPIPILSDDEDGGSLSGGGGGAGTVLQGYGVNLDIKNMEYMNLDERGGSVSEDGDDGFGGDDDLENTFEATEEVGGVVFSKVLERHPEINRELGILRSELLESAASEGTAMKVWAMRDLGLQATQHILAAKKAVEIASAGGAPVSEEADPLQRLQEISQNFPVHAQSLSGIKVNDKLRKGVTHNANWPIGGTWQQNRIFVNGVSLDPGAWTFNLFSFLKALRQEANHLTQLQRLALPESHARKLLELGGATTAGGGQTSGGMGMGMGMASNSDELRVDIHKGSKYAVTFVNNLERDSRYSHFTDSVRQLLLQSWQLHAVKRNLYHVVFVIDPATEEGLAAVQQLNAFHTSGWPARFGVLLTTAETVAMDTAWGSGDDGGLGDDAAPEKPQRWVWHGGDGAPLKGGNLDNAPVAGHHIAQLFSALRSVHGASAAFAFLVDVADSAFVTSEGGDAPTFRPPFANLVVEAYAGASATAAGSWSTSIYTQEAWGILRGLGSGAVDFSNGDRKALIGDGSALRFAFEGARNMSHFASKRGLPVNCLLVNGRLEYEPGMLLDAQQTVMMMLGREQHFFANAVANGRVSDKTKSFYTWALRKSGAVARYHPLLEEAAAEQTFVSLLDERAMQLAAQLRFVHATGTDDDVKPVSVVVMTDLSCVDGLRLAQEALRFVEGPSSNDAGGGAANGASPVGTAAELARLAFVLNPSLAAFQALDQMRHSSSSEAQVEDRACDAATTEEAALKPAVVFVAAVRVLAESPHACGLAFLRHLLDFIVAAHTSSNPAASLAGFDPDAAIEHAAKLSCSAGSDGVVGCISTGRLKKMRRALRIADESGGDGGACASRFTVPPELASELANMATIAESTLGQSGTDVGPGKSAIFANGRRVHVNDHRFLAEDFEIFARAEASARATPVVELLDSVEFQGMDPDSVTSEWRSDVAMRASAFLGMYAQKARVDVDVALKRLHQKLTFVDMMPAGHNEKNGGLLDGVTVTAVLDPLSEAAQRVAPLLLVLRDTLGLRVRLLLTPNLEVTEFPLQNFYRYVVTPEMRSVDAVARFERLPQQHILTMRVDTPERWNVQQSESDQDLDNLRCDEMRCESSGEQPGHTRIGYRLKGLVIAGQCYDTTSARPPNGLQLALRREVPAARGVPPAPVLFDTLVMQNLGYFQLKARPGVWSLALAEGRAKELFDVLHNEDDSRGEGALSRRIGVAPGGGASDTVAVVPSQQVVVRDFYDAVVPLNVRKKPGMENEPLLEGEGVSRPAPSSVSSVSAGLLNSISSLWGGGDDGDDGESGGDETVHVFSLATGHLYERFLRIMMLSVHKSCSTNVKFWLFENYLSPKFKSEAQAMAAHYGFEVTFVTYKWPSWLRQQTEKQRIIWGYKILFLDVLFPLDLKKVIYVDADQVVRGDLKELWDMDLQGAPYGYTPFCDSRKETLGYQFWRGGFWEEHLQGRPYHISALYVVDLQRFRRSAIGDALRSVYDNLSRDPGSLANLDQDLPNYAQHMVPIFSLPQEWLWCESWCSDGSKAASKTIDLCNNPLHKEPKLDMARRVISGDLFEQSWNELDAEVASVVARSS